MTFATDKFWCLFSTWQQAKSVLIPALAEVYMQPMNPKLVSDFCNWLWMRIPNLSLHLIPPSPFCTFEMDMIKVSISDLRYLFLILQMFKKFKIKQFPSSFLFSKFSYLLQDFCSQNCVLMNKTWLQPFMHHCSMSFSLNFRFKIYLFE